MNAPIRFGTDGWRAIIADDFTFNNVNRVAQATADYWGDLLARRTPDMKQCKQLIVVGYDRRFLSDEFARCAAGVFCANDFAVVLSSVPTPTPAISYAVRQLRAVGGVMITASHNPPKFNGYKLKSHFGGPSEPLTCSDVESWLDRNPVQSIGHEDALASGRLRIKDLRPAHYSTIKKQVDFSLISRSGLRFAHDALFGVGAGCFDSLLEGTTCRVTTLNGSHDPLFGGINPEPIPKNYTLGSAYLKKHPHDLCLVTDGDADRVGGMDGRGNPLSTHQIICLLLQHLHGNRGLRGRVVKALTTTSMVDKMCGELGLELVETGVGFKYICSEMLRGGVLLGAEESGGIGFPGHIPERDGILAGMMLLELLAVERQPLTRLLAGLEKRFGPHRYGRIDTHFPVEKRADLMAFCKAHPPSRLGRSPLTAVKTYDGVKFCSCDGSWLMLRGSGTEPVLRIYAESPSDALTRRLLQEGLRLTRQV